MPRFEKGRPIRSWQPKWDGERNEALDLFVYATAAAPTPQSRRPNQPHPSSARLGWGDGTYKCLPTSIRWCRTRTTTRPASVKR
ncbi:MAG: phage terminase large subunit family protein [Magnetospirillum sp. WYHS-4]